MESYPSGPYPSTNQAKTLSQVAFSNHNFSFRTYSLEHGLPPPRCSLVYYGMPPATRQPAQFYQYLRIAHSIQSGPCVAPHLLETNSNHPDSSISSFSDAEPGANASEPDLLSQRNQYTQITSSPLHTNDAATTTFQTPGPSQLEDPLPKPKRTKKSCGNSTSTTPHPAKERPLSKGSKRGTKTTGRFKCPFCPNLFAASKGDLNRHFESLAHRKPSHICEMCKKKFTRADALKRHRLSTCPALRNRTTKAIGSK